jgi:hypothetical protein
MRNVVYPNIDNFKQFPAKETWRKGLQNSNYQGRHYKRVTLTIKNDLDKCRFKERLQKAETSQERPQNGYEQILVEVFALKFGSLCGLEVRVLDYRSGGPGSIPATTTKKSSGSGTGSTQPREYN